MTGGRWPWAVLAALFVLHNDLWWWEHPAWWLGLPASLAYHVLFGAVVTLALWPLARRLGLSEGDGP